MESICDRVYRGHVFIEIWIVHGAQFAGEMNLNRHWWNCGSIERRDIVAMEKKNYAYGLVILNLIIQIASCFWYNKWPEFVWVLGSCLVILIPLLFGLRMGLLGLLPVAVSEFVWFYKVHSSGPLLHLAAFTVVVLFMAAAHQKLAKMPRRNRAVLSAVLFIAGLAGEELLNQVLRQLVLHKPADWNAVSGQVFSPVILVVLIMLVVFVDRLDIGSQENIS